jgi:hypothetical protein
VLLWLEFEDSSSLVLLELRTPTHLYVRLHSFLQLQFICTDSNIICFFNPILKDKTLIRWSWWVQL